MNHLNKIKLSIAFLGIFSAACAQEKSNWALVNKSNIEVGKVAPEVSFKDVNGKTVKLSDYKGKIILLDVWATWCKPCIESMPEMNRVYQNNKDEIVMLAVCSADNLDNFNRFVKANSGKYEFTYLFDPNGLKPTSSDFRGIYGINGFPTTLVINQKGIIAGYGSDHDITISEHEHVKMLINQFRVSPKKAYKIQEVIDDSRAGNYKEAFRKSQSIQAESDSAKNDLMLTQVEALLHFDEKAAVELAKKHSIENDNEYQFLVNLGSTIAQIKDLSAPTYLYGAEVLKKVEATAPAHEGFLILYDLLGRCLFNAGKVDDAIVYAEKSIAEGKKTNSPADTNAYLESVLEKYKKAKG